ncbi:hypothetical protein [Noviherbaspirillum pedocola]|uniref:Uncharacterized protein n=1 Tax=Noviherbaspirillum pedocola TaxID=2801341 RepID=A0A934T146_9BURK|nr:hypothetical protein [Noviherbaspirillum pedocola]MBK4735518.1 hypothetical protein [Noviherbaspirillum pedocola]
MRTYQRAKIVLAAALTAILCQSCGGGGSSSTDTGTSKDFAIDSSIPAASKAKISSVDTPQGSVGMTQQLPALPDDGKDYLFVASGSDGPYLMAVGRKQITFNTATTAEAFVRIANGDLYSTDPSISKTVTGSPSFPYLTAKISDALKAGTPPIQSDAVIDAVWQVAMETRNTLANETALSKAPKILASAETVQSLPYYFFQDDATDKMWLLNAPGNNLELKTVRRFFGRPQQHLPRELRKRKLSLARQRTCNTSPTTAEASPRRILSVRRHSLP